MKVQNSNEEYGNIHEVVKGHKCIYISLWACNFFLLPKKYYHKNIIQYLHKKGHSTNPICMVFAVQKGRSDINKVIQALKDEYIQY